MCFLKDNIRMLNKTKIKITEVNNPHWYLESYYSPRKAKNPGDIEVVNNTVLGFLKRMKSAGIINFEILTD